LPARGVTHPWRFEQTRSAPTVDRAVRDRWPDRILIWAGAEALWIDRPDLPRAVVDLIDSNPLEFWRGFLSHQELRQRYRALRGIDSRQATLASPCAATPQPCASARRMHDGGAGACAVQGVHRRRRLGLSARANVTAHFTWAGAAARVDALPRPNHGRNTLRIG
jgi:hypothetical protein